MRDLRLAVARPGKANDQAELLRYLPADERLASNTFPHSEEAITAFQPNLEFIRSYVPDLFGGIGKLGQVTGYYDGNGHYVRAGVGAANLFSYVGGSLEPITRDQQYGFFGSEAGAKRRCPGGATQPASDGSSPFVDPPVAGGVDSSSCNPGDVPPGP
jgi:phospholipid/cholesterol/gamma-HCH transport system substrate-binding protein